MERRNSGDLGIGHESMEVDHYRPTRGCYEWWRIVWDETCTESFLSSLQSSMTIFGDTLLNKVDTHMEEAIDDFVHILLDSAKCMTKRIKKTGLRILTI